MAMPTMPPAPTHPLALKVLRASRPTLHPSSSSSSASACLVLPAAFGAIYLGQHFSGLLALSILPTHHKPVLRPVLRVDLLPPSRPNKIPLGTVDAPVLHPRKPSQSSHLTRDAEASWTEGEGLELAVSHEMTELGLHTLSCTVSYDELLLTSSPTVPPPGLSSTHDLLSPSSDQVDDTDSLARTTRTFRKLYKFQVLNPLSVKTKLFSPLHVPSSPSTDATLTNASLSPLGSTTSGHGYLEVQIQNQTSNELVFGQLSLETVPPQEEESRSWTSIGRGDAAQTVFRIPLHTDRTSLGRLAMTWKGPFGEPGALKTSPLAGLPLSSISQLLVHQRAKRVRLGEPFEIEFSIACNAIKDLVIVPLESSLTIAIGQSPLAPLPVNDEERVFFKVTRVPIETGLIEVAGVEGLKSGLSGEMVDRWESLGYVWCEKAG